jgi:putative ABC transport system permease protein
MRQALLVAVGLAVGIGLVLTVTAAAAGVSDAQGAVLHSLYGVGTDVTVTKAPPASSSGSTNGIFSPGTTPQHNDVLRTAPGLGLLNVSAVDAVRRLKYVAAAAGGLTLSESTFNIPSASEAAKTGSLGSVTSFTVDGVDLAHLDLGPFSSAKIVAGQTFAGADSASNVAIVDTNYAAAHGLLLGSPITVGNVAFKVIALIGQAQGGSAADVYIPLGRAQALAQYQGTSSVAHEVDTVYVAATSAAHVAAVQGEIAKLLPSATATTSGNLASNVSGSLASAASLATDLGRWLAIAVLIAAFAVSCLLTAAAVARRVREIGTLKALGWRNKRIVAQIMAESAVVGVLGAAIGVAMGLGGAALIEALAPTLSATVAQSPGATPAQGVTISGGVLHQTTLPGAAHTVTVHLGTPIRPSTLALAVALAVAGALIAGSLGAWRATRLSPVDALAQVT